jgi:hypothetical protein
MHGVVGHRNALGPRAVAADADAAAPDAGGGTDRVGG